MALKKSDIEVQCAHCEYLSSDKIGSFDITVPITDLTTGTCQLATLQCAVSTEEHRLKLLDWNLESDNTTRVSDDFQRRMSAVLAFIAEHKICGNRKLCPAEVVEIVQRLSSE